MTLRCLVDPAALLQDEAVLVGERAHHLARVHRVRVGDAVVLFDGRGAERPAAVCAVTREDVRLRFSAPPREGARRDRVRATLLQAVPKGDKLETIARQATELGVERFVPVWTERSVPRERADRAADRHRRLVRVVEEAARQCGRADLPEVLPAVALREALDLGASCALRLVAWEQAVRPLHDLTDPGGGGVALLVGPEGGLGAEEAQAAEAAGFVTISLGPRILRAETVAPALLAVLSARWGDMASVR